jgi:hypothetical protein
LFGANLANRSQRGSPVLALTLPDRLSAYAEHVVLALLVGTSPATRATTSTSVYKAPRRVNLRPLDSVKGALGGTEVRRLRPLQKKATRTAARLRQLQATEAYEIIVEQGPAALLSLPEELDKFASTTIPEMMKVPIGPKRRPDTVRLLWRLFDYVCNTSGGYHDRLVATILDERGFMLGPSEDISDSSLRKWRDQHDRPEG